MSRWSAIFCVLAVWAGFLHAGDQELMDGLDNTRVIKTGDVLGILILKGGVEPVEARVEGNGQFKPPFLKPMKAVGLTCRKLANDIRREMERTFFGVYPVLVKFAPASFREVMSVLDDRRAIQPGDKLWVRLIESRRAPDDYAVAKEGLIKLRHLGPVKVTGLTCKKLAQLISQKLAALPPASQPFKYSVAPTVAVCFEVIQPTRPVIPVKIR